jgi:CDP-diacylglycerol---serine O-phosphatidyltransferase
MIRVPRSVIPSLFTIANLFSGFIAVKTAMIDRDFVTAGWFILLGALFDAFDGIMARLTKSSSEFGVELDSLADVVTFGVGPSAIVYTLFFHQFDPIGLLVAALPAMCGAIRLARFNVQLVGFDKDYFRGLPIPSAALLVISYVTFYYLRPSDAISQSVYDVGMWLVVISAALLMVSTIKYDTIPKMSKKAIMAHPVRFGVFLSAIILAIVTRGSAIFPLFVLFVLYGIIRSIIDRTGRFLKERRAAALLDLEEIDKEERSTFGI